MGRVSRTEEPARAGLDLYRGRGLDRNVRALGATSFLQDVASEMVYPLLPAFVGMVGGGAFVLGAMESAASAVLAIVKGAMGPVSDRVGRRKPFVVAGYGLSTLLRPLMAIAAGAGQVVAIRTGDRLAKGLRTAPRDALIAESSRPEERAYAFSFHRGLDHLGAAVGPLVAAALLWVAPGEVRLVLFAATIPALAGWLVVTFVVREPARVDEGAAPPGDEASWAARRRLRGPLVAVLIFSLGNASDVFILLRVGELGWGPFGVVVLWSGVHVVKWLASAPAGRLADRVGAAKLVIGGWVIYAVVYVGFAFAETVWAMLGLVFVYALHDAATEGSEKALFVSLAAGDVGAGSVLGAYHLASGLGVAAASVSFGALWTVWSPATAFLTAAALAFLGAVVLVASQGRRRVGVG